jgi:3-methylcrotonyl-CoA carboxylase alpha subunit
MRILSKILVANRGEIAVRILKTLNRLSIRSVLIYTKEEEGSLAVKMAGETVLLEGNTLIDTYLNSEQIIRIAKQKAVNAIHPGYGFLSENPYFAKACESAGIIFIGPSGDSIQLMADKIAAREFAIKLGIPVLKSLYGSTAELLQKARDNLSFPILIKPVWGGGGKGMRIVFDYDMLEREIEISCRESANYFGSSIIYLEEYLKEAKHIEVQVLGDGKGNVIHLFERECSLQRRFQKIVEEAPSPSLNFDDRKRITDFAIKLASSARYRNAGTVEFVIDREKNVFFIEMNTRIQVEHPVTESVTGIDIVEEQLWIAEYETLRLAQNDICLKGHAIELRLNAEDANNEFMPSPGDLLFYKEPEAPGLRIDKGFTIKASISTQYDPLIAKIVMLGESRTNAIEKLLHVLPSFIILGIQTNIDYLAALLMHPGFASGDYSTHFVKNEREYFNELFKTKKTIISWNILAAIWVYALSYREDNLEGLSSDKSPWHQSGHWRTIPFYEFIFEYKNYSFLADISSSNISVKTTPEETTFFINGTSNNINLSLNGKEYKNWFAWNANGILFIDVNGWKAMLYPSYLRDRNSVTMASLETASEKSEIILSPMHGKIINLNVPLMSKVKKGEVLLILESMKMENNIIATRDGLVHSFLVKKGEQVEKDAPLLILGG